MSQKQLLRKQAGKIFPKKDSRISWLEMATSTFSHLEAKRTLSYFKAIAVFVEPKFF